MRGQRFQNGSSHYSGSAYQPWNQTGFKFQLAYFLTYHQQSKSEVTPSRNEAEATDRFTTLLKKLWNENSTLQKCVKIKWDYTGKEFMTVPATWSKCFQKYTCSFLLLFNNHCVTDYPASETPDSVCLKVNSPFSPSSEFAKPMHSDFIGITVQVVTLARIMIANKFQYRTLL